MEPMLADGMILIFSKVQVAAAGDIVGVCYRPGVHGGDTPWRVKRLTVAPQATLPWFEVETLNPFKRVKIARHDVLALHRCTGVLRPLPRQIVIERQPACFS